MALFGAARCARNADDERLKRADGSMGRPGLHAATSPDSFGYSRSGRY
jgi:hypothetical protein